MEFIKYGLPVLTVIAVGLLGRTRRLGFWGAIVVSILLTPIGGFIVAMISGAKPIVDEKDEKEEAARKPLPKRKPEEKKG